MPTAPAVAPVSLFGTNDPRAVIARATEISNELARVVRDKRLYVKIGNKEHVFVEGWTLLGSILGLFPYTVWSRPLDDGWEARVEARTADGRAIAAAEAECRRSERKWARADDFTVRSMAQTRATSKALRLPLGFVMQLAGFDATPADEMLADKPAAAQATPEQHHKIRTLIDELVALDPNTDWRARAHSIAGVSPRALTRPDAELLIGELEGWSRPAA